VLKICEKNNLNGIQISTLPKNEWVGDDIQKWKIVIPDIGQNLKNTQIGVIMENLAYELKNIKRTDFPIFLNPITASFLDVAVHAKIRQYLADSTIEKNLRYARFMENHPAPVDFRNPTPENFLRHVDYRLEFENPPATPNALKHEKKAMLMFLRAYNLYTETWKQLVKTPPVIDTDDYVEVPFPSVINELYHAKYSDNKYENTLLQTIVFMDINFGMRPPSEICNLNLGDVIINKDRTGYIKIHEEKKRGKCRVIIPFNKNVLSSPVFKTVGNYINNWRYKVANGQSQDALFLHPNGTRITGKYLRDKITPVGKKIAGEHFHLYTMRHTCATYLYEYTKELEVVRKRLGHKKISTTMKYVHVADDMKRQIGKRNLFNLALRFSKRRGKQDKIDCWTKKAQSNTFTPRNLGGPGRI